ncbi:hypothetical protein FGO68_gene4764 [Halteria grandinella]|uniref:Uncharacterized protein n=1 Tax=Halteria grandinella TaxID=5974 RepID=A0A8J8P2U7_HALGN|nr:hypothetical protein FGO68_gene4764 [Halteria grandinella]
MFTSQAPNESASSPSLEIDPHSQTLGQLPSQSPSPTQKLGSTTPFLTQSMLVGPSNQGNYHTQQHTMQPNQMNQSLLSSSYMNNRTADVVKWSDSIAQVARSTDRNMQKISAYNDAQNRPLTAHSPVMMVMGDINYNSQSSYGGRVRPPPNGIPKLKLKKVVRQGDFPSGSPPRMNNFMKTQQYDQNMAPNSQRDGFSFGNGSQGIMNSLNQTRNFQSNSLSRSLKPQATMFQKLDFYGRRLTDGQLDDQFSASIGAQQRNGSVEIPSHVQDTIELELRSHLDMAKSDLNMMHQDIENKIKMEINKYPQFAQEESEVNYRLGQLQQRFDVFEDEIIKRTQEIIRGYHSIRNDQIVIQRKVGDSLSQIINRCTHMKDLEMEMGGFRNQMEEQVSRLNEETSILKSQMKAQKFEIETDLLKKVKLHQSQHDVKLDEFYKFKADVYAYLDGKYESITHTYGGKLKSLTDFADQTELKLRQLADVKQNSELHVQDFMTKYSQKLHNLEDAMGELNLKHSGLETHQTEVHAFLQRIKKSIQDLQKDHNLAARVDLLEQKVQDDFLKGLITMQLDFSLEDRFKLFSSEFQSLQKEVNHMGDKVATIDPQVVHRCEEMKKKLEKEIQSINSKMKAEFLFKQNESEKTYMQSFNEIRQIVLDKMLELDNKIQQSGTRIDTIEHQMVDVGQKYEQFQELFATLISEMQTASDENDGSKILVKRVSPELEDARRGEAMSTQMSQGGSPQKVEAYGGGNGGAINLRIDGAGSSYSQSLNNSPNDKTLHPVKEVARSIKEQQVAKGSIIVPPVTKAYSNLTPAKAGSRQSEPINNSLPTFMVSYIQNQRAQQYQNNKIFPVNSPERKSHDMMLISPNKKRQTVSSKKKGARGQQVLFNDEANVIERTDSCKVLDSDTVKALTEQRIQRESHVHTRKYKENLIKMIQRRKPNTFELTTIEDAKKIVYLLGTNADDSLDVKSSLNIDEEIELRDGEFSRSQSSIHTLDLIDNSAQSSSLSMVAKAQQQQQQQQMQKNQGSGQSVNKSGNSNPHSKSSKQGASGGAHTFLSEEEFNDYYEYSEDEDEEIFPFIDTQQAAKQLADQSSLSHSDDRRSNTSSNGRQMLFNKKQQLIPLGSILDQVKVEDLHHQPPNLPIIIDQSAPLGTLPSLVDENEGSGVQSEDNNKSKGVRSHQEKSSVKSGSSTPKQGQHSRKPSGDQQVILTPDMKRKGEMISLDLCAELIAKEIAFLLRGPINRNNPPGTYMGNNITPSHRRTGSNN